MSTIKKAALDQYFLCCRALTTKSVKANSAPGLTLRRGFHRTTTSLRRPGNDYSRALRSSIRSLNNTSSNHVEAVLKQPQETTSTPMGEGSVDLPQANADETRVAVGWPDGAWSRYHHFWLRDHCRCPECFHPVTKQRLVDTFALPRGLFPRGVKSTIEGLEVIWPTSPPHISLYPWQWLQRNSYDPQLEPSPIVGTQPPPAPEEKILWSAGIVKDPPTVQYEDIMSDELAVYKWLKKIDQFGFCFVTGVPPTTKDTEEVIRRISFIRHTQYGGFWDFTSDLAHGDTAYTNLGLPAHTDNSYFTDPCGLQVFHLLSHEQGTGGQTLLVDGFYAASILKELYPDSYRLLSTVLVPTHSAGDEEFLYRARPLSGHPILQHDPINKDSLIQVRYGNDHRSAMRNLDPSNMMAWYDALRHWNKCLTSADSEYWVQLTAGTVVVVDNHRVLHGRSAFTGKRRMCGAYIGLDDWRARLDALRGRYGQGRVVIKERSVWDLGF